MPKTSERDDVLNALASKILSDMADDLILDATIQSHQEVARGRAVCRTCNTRCCAIHVPNSVASSQSAALASRAGTPMAVDGAENGSSSSFSIKGDGNITLDCMNCDRQVAYNRYASHLSSCMGIQSSTRRGSVRGNGLKPKNSIDTPRSTTPTSELGNISDDSRSLKGKTKSKSKREDDAEFNLKRKRLASPQVSPTKKTKKKVTGSPVSRLKSDPDSGTTPISSQPLSAPSSVSRVPSKLRDSSIATLLDRSPSSSSSRSSSPGAPSVGTVATSSSFSGTARTQSPSFAGKGLVKKKVTGTGPPKRLSPPRPPPPPVQLDFTIDVEGEETGSSTDTDSS